VVEPDLGGGVDGRWFDVFGDLLLPYAEDGGRHDDEGGHVADGREEGEREVALVLVARRFVVVGDGLERVVLDPLAGVVLDGEGLVLGDAGRRVGACLLDLVGLFKVVGRERESCGAVC